MPDSDLHWSEGARLRPSDYFRLGELPVALPRAVELANSHGVNLDGLGPSAAEVSFLDELLDELTAEDEALENWAQNGDPRSTA